MTNLLQSVSKIRLHTSKRGKCKGNAKGICLIKPGVISEKYLHIREAGAQAS